MTSSPILETVVADHRARLKGLPQPSGDPEDDRLRCDEYRGILRSYRRAVEGSSRIDDGEGALGQLRELAKEAMGHLGGGADLAATSLKDYDHKRFGPYLGVSDEGSAAAVIRQAALNSPKVRVAGLISPLVVGVAHDAERLGAIGEVAVGPDEYAKIRLACVGRILTSTNVGTRLNLRFYKRNPVVSIPAGTTADVVGATEVSLTQIFAPFLNTPDGKHRPLTVFIQFDPESRRSFANRVAILKALARFAASGDAADPAVHRLGFLIRIGFGERGERAALLGVNLARAARLAEVAIDGVVRKAADDLVSLPGLLNYLPPERLEPVLRRAAEKGIRVRPKNTVDPDTVARNVWASLAAARHMGLDLGKYGTLPLTLEECDQVIGQVQGWFSDWTAAPVFFLDQGIVSADRVYIGDTLIPGLHKWLKIVARHRVPVVLIDTADKSLGWRLLKEQAGDKGLLTTAQVRAIDKFAQALGVRALWAGGITLAQCLDFGRLGVFGIYVTSAAASSAPVPADEGDPMLAALKEPTYDGVSRAKLLLEAGFLAGRFKGTERGRGLERLAREFIRVCSASDAEAPTKAGEALFDGTCTAWDVHLKEKRISSDP